MSIIEIIIRTVEKFTKKADTKDKNESDNYSSNLALHERYAKILKKISVKPRLNFDVCRKFEYNLTPGVHVIKPTSKSQIFMHRTPIKELQRTPIINLLEDRSKK